MKTNNFVTISTFGDVIWSLCVIKILGGGNLYVKLNGLDDFCRTHMRWKDAGPHSGRLTQQDYEFMEPLLKAQDYLKEVKVWTDQQDDYPILLDHWKFHQAERWRGNQTECYALTLGWNINDREIKKKLLYEPWLTPVEPLKIPKKYIAVHRAERYNYNGKPSEDWYSYFENGLEENGFFIGTDKEHADFEKMFGVKIYHQKVSNLLEMARYIQGSELIIANQSIHVAIAIALGKSYRLEIRKDYEVTKTASGYGDNWFPRINGYYF